MSIKINDLNNSQPPRIGDGNRTQGPAGQAPGKAEGETRQPAAGDRVTLTQTAQQLRELEAEVRKQPVVDNNRVEALRAAIANGEYQIDATRIAEQLMRIEDEL